MYEATVWVSPDSSRYRTLYIFTLLAASGARGKKNDDNDAFLGFLSSFFLCVCCCCCLVTRLPPASALSLFMSCCCCLSLGLVLLRRGIRRGRKACARNARHFISSSSYSLSVYTFRPSPLPLSWWLRVRAARVRLICITSLLPSLLSNVTCSSLQCTHLASSKTDVYRKSSGYFTSRIRIEGVRGIYKLQESYPSSILESICILNETPCGEFWKRSNASREECIDLVKGFSAQQERVDDFVS